MILLQIRGWKMKKILLMLLLPTLVLASEYKSRFFAGGIIAHSLIESSAKFCGNGDLHILGGWEFRPVSWFSMSPALVFERNGWSWDRAGHEGSISYFNPYLRLSLDFHVKGVVASVGGSYGRPVFFWGELDGKETTTDDSLDMDYSGSIFYSIGYTIKDRYRVGLIQRMDGLYISDHEKYETVRVFMIGAFFTYLF
jgi:hypothetical protein